MNGAKLNDSVKPKVDKTKSHEGFPVLSFAVSLGKYKRLGSKELSFSLLKQILVLLHNKMQRLDQWDLDEVLQNLKKDGLPLRQRVSAEPSQAG